MELTIKQLKQNSQIFVPQTTAEAVIVKDGSTIITLDTLLNRKVENIITPAGSGLDAKQTTGTSYVITHSNSITSNEAPSAVKVQYDNRGHIVATQPTSNMNITVDEEAYVEYNGSKEASVSLGNDFRIDGDNKIILKWNNL